MSQKPMPITRAGLARLEAELAELRDVRRPKIAARIHQARQETNLRTDAEFADARAEQALIEGHIQALSAMLEHVYVIDEERARGSDRVRPGSHVSVRDPGGRDQHFEIVGPAEANPSAGRISNESPVGRALLGKRVGDEVQVMAPAGIVRFSITKIE